MGGPWLEWLTGVNGCCLGRTAWATGKAAVHPRLAGMARPHLPRGRSATAHPAEILKTLALCLELLQVAHDVPPSEDTASALTEGRIIGLHITAARRAPLRCGRSRGAAAYSSKAQQEIMLVREVR